MLQRLIKNRKPIWLLAIIAGLLINQTFQPLMPEERDPGGKPLPAYPAMSRPPKWALLPLEDWLNTFIEYTREIGVVEITRAVGKGVDVYLDVVIFIFAGGAKDTAWQGLPWLTVTCVMFLLGYYLKGLPLGILAGVPFIFFAVFNQYHLAMLTFSFVLVTSSLSIVLGLLFGVLAWRFRRVEQLLIPVLNLLQSLPHFSYLLPVVVFIGVGFHAGAIATILFATPPMIRLVLLGLRKVPEEVVDAGNMNGCTPLQLLFKVRLPTARQEILIGVNQVIMQSLAMKVIASFIGAQGLGYKLLQLLQALKVGRSVELGVAIVLIAVSLDRLSLAWAHRQPEYRTGKQSLLLRYKNLLRLISLAGLSYLIASQAPFFWAIPKELTVSTSFIWENILTWMTVNLYDSVQVFRRFVSLEILMPMRLLYLYMPWLAVMAIAVGSAYIVGGLRATWPPFIFVGFIAASGWWDRAMITTYMVSFALLVCFAIGFPLGVWASLSERRSRFVLLVTDTLQTFPSFIYLIPVIMLLQVNDVAAVTAVLGYTFVPVIRYTIEGIRSVPEHLAEAADMSGCTTWQKLWKVKIPLALPHITVGANQAVMFALFMAIIAAFIGTQDLGQEMMRAIAFTNVGRG